MNFDTILKELSAEFIEGLQKANFDIKAEKENGEFEVIANMETPDRVGETIIVKGWDLDNYKKNPILLFGHDYRDIKNIIGKVTDVQKTEVNGTPVLTAKGIFASTETGQVAKQLYEEGILKTVSVGFKVLERDQKDTSVITKAELLELSFVPVPCHQDAVSTLDKELVKKGMEMGIIKEAEEEEKPTDSERLEKIEESLTKLLDIVSDITGKVAEKEETEEEKKQKDLEKALKAVATIAASSVNKYFKK